MPELDFPAWIRITHFINIIFISFLIRSGNEILVFATGEWHRFWPYSWAVFPQAFKDMITYLNFDLPPTLPGEPYNALQKLTYGAVVFILAPFQILTGAAQSPALEARFPWYVRMF